MSLGKEKYNPQRVLLKPVLTHPQIIFLKLRLLSELPSIPAHRYVVPSKPMSIAIFFFCYNYANLFRFKRKQTTNLVFIKWERAFV